MFICTSNAQTLDIDGVEVTSVAGVNFGIKKTTLKSKMNERFNAYEEEYYNVIYYKNICIGGTNYDYVIFYFLNDTFVSVSRQKYMQKNFAEAKM